MKLVVVGGSSRNIGKTTVVAGLIRALPQYQWTAIKLTQYGHGICSQDGNACDCAPEEHPFAIDEESDRSSGTDTSRLLAAGARRALWARVRQGMLETALPALRAAIANDGNIIIESNSIVRYWRPTVYLTVLDPAKQDFKVSAREFLPQADACLMLQPGWSESAWDGVLRETVQSKPLFPWTLGGSLVPEMIAFVEARLRSGSSAW
jgi:hypothetical protein